MTTIQEVLNQKYPNKSQVEKIDLKDLNFDQPSKLIIADYSNLKEISGSYIFNLTKATISNCPRLEKANINRWFDNQVLILHNLPNLKELSCSGNNLTELDLTSCSNLQTIDCSANQLAKLEFYSCSNLKEVNCSSNHITNLIFADCPNLKAIDASFNWTRTSEFIINISNCPNISELNFHESKVADLIIDKNLFNISKVDFFNSKLITNLTFLDDLIKNAEALTHLDISYNDFAAQDLSFFNKFKNLEVLRIMGNNFCGSLEPLQNLKKLRKIEISDTNLDSGLGYLPYNLDKLTLNQEYTEKNTGCLKIKKELEKENSEWWNCFLEYYDDEDHEIETIYDIKLWKENHPSSWNLKESLAETNSDLDIYEFDVHEFLHQQNIFFNVTTNTFQGDLQSLVNLLLNKSLFEQKEFKILLLESWIQELTKLIKKQKQKIVDAYLHFCSEKKLLENKNTLQELITIHLEITKFRKKRIPISEYSQQRQQYKIFHQQLKDRLSEELVEEVDIILDNCQELASWELELENKINAKMLLLGESKQLPQIAESRETKSIELQSQFQSFLVEIKVNLATCQKQIQTLQDENQQLEAESRQLVNNSLLLSTTEQLNKNNLTIVEKTHQIEQLKEQTRQLEEQFQEFQQNQQTQIIQPPKTI